MPILKTVYENFTNSCELSSNTIRTSSNRRLIGRKYGVDRLVYESNFHFTEPDCHLQKGTLVFGRLRIRESRDSSRWRDSQRLEAGYPKWPVKRHSTRARPSIGTFQKAAGILSPVVYAGCLYRFLKDLRGLMYVDVAQCFPDFNGNGCAVRYQKTHRHCQRNTT
jgi:hypothetical protein